MTVKIEFIDEQTRAVPYLDNRALLKKKGQFGHWFVTLEHGETPLSLKEGAFLSPEKAAQSVMSHEAQHKKFKAKAKN